MAAPPTGTSCRMAGRFALFASGAGSPYCPRRPGDEPPSAPGAGVNRLGRTRPAMASAANGDSFDAVPDPMMWARAARRRVPPARPSGTLMEAFLVSTGIVALAEIGDKTQLLALLLAAKFRRPWPIVAGILAATLANHALAGALGAWITTLLGPQALRWVLGLSFLAMAVWIVIPDKIDGEAVPTRHGVFITTLVAFFLAEMGDKTQIATVALAARFDSLVWVIIGTTLGLMLANVPAVFLGDGIARRMPTRLVHAAAAAIFAVLGVLTLLGAGGKWGF